MAAVAAAAAAAPAAPVAGAFCWKILYRSACLGGIDRRGVVCHAHDTTKHTTHTQHVGRSRQRTAAAVGRTKKQETFVGVGAVGGGQRRRPQSQGAAHHSSRGRGWVAAAAAAGHSGRGTAVVGGGLVAHQGEEPGRGHRRRCTAAHGPHRRPDGGVKACIADAHPPPPPRPPYHPPPPPSTPPQDVPVRQTRQPPPPGGWRGPTAAS